MKKKIIAVIVAVCCCLGILLTGCDGTIRHDTSVQVRGFFDKENIFEIENMDFYDILYGGSHHTLFKGKEIETFYEDVIEQFEGKDNYNLYAKGKSLFIEITGEDYISYFVLYDGRMLSNFGGNVAGSEINDEIDIILPIKYFVNHDEILDETGGYMKYDEKELSAGRQIELNCTFDKVVDFYKNFDSYYDIVELSPNKVELSPNKVELSPNEYVSFTIEGQSENGKEYLVFDFLDE